MEVGYEFGTTYSTLCFSPGKGVDGCVPESGKIYIPTVVGYRPDKTHAIGLGALLEKDLVVYRDIKRYFGLNKFNKDVYLEKLKPTIEVVVEDWGCSIGPVDGSRGKTKSVLVLASDFITGLVQLAIKMTGQQVSVSVCSVPAAYNSYQRSFIYESCKLSSISVQAVVNEPTAAGLSAFITTPKSSVNYLLVYDFGGGFDSSLLVVGPAYVGVLDSMGDNYLGGRDVDNKLLEVCAERLNVDKSVLDQYSMEALKIDIVDNPGKTVRRILLKSKEIKSIHITFQEFAAICKPFVERAKKVVLSLLMNRQLTKCAAVLIGGSSVLPGVVDSVASLPMITKVIFDRKTYRAAVALGGALYAQTFSGSSRYRLIDSISGSLSDEFKNLKAVCIFPKGHPIPSTVESDFTMPNSNTGVVLMQGESSMANMNEMTFSASVRTTTYPPRSVVQQKTKIFEDGRVEVYLNDLKVENTVKPRIPDKSELSPKFVSSDDVRIGPEVSEIKSFYAKLLQETKLPTLSKEQRKTVYKRHGFESF
uniref:Hsp70h n=1 Tax=Pineapple mealybug wilt-associated virus 4 TaxID=497390 RepID=B0ZE41_9CLOS|nr:Hsp70h [Pineapple mealybug wilt-associated virus 4]